MRRPSVRERRPEVGDAKVVLLRPQGRPSPATIRHPEDTGTTASFWADEAGAVVLRIEGREGRFQQDDAEGPVERRLARLMLTLVARGYFNEAEHQEGLTVLWGTALDDLSTDGARRAASVVLHLMAPALIP